MLTVCLSTLSSFLCYVRNITGPKNGLDFHGSLEFYFQWVSTLPPAYKKYLKYFEAFPREDTLIFGSTIIRSSGLAPFPLQDPYILSLGPWPFSRPTLNPLLTLSLNITYVLMTLRFLLFLQTSPLSYRFCTQLTIWHLPEYTSPPSQISHSWKRRSIDCRSTLHLWKGSLSGICHHHS